MVGSQVPTGSTWPNAPGTTNASGFPVDPKSSDNSDTMVTLMKQMNASLAKMAGDRQAQPPTPTAPVVLATAGIR